MNSGFEPKMICEAGNCEAPVSNSLCGKNYCLDCYLEIDALLNQDQSLDLGFTILVVLSIIFSFAVWWEIFRLIGYFLGSEP